MKNKKFNGFDNNGYLPKGIYHMTLEEIETNFSNNKSLERKEIMKEYKKYLNKLKKTGYFMKHWIVGSFITSKEKPNDIDTITEFNGLEIDTNNDKNKIDTLIFNSKEITNGFCHSFRIYYYPPQNRIAYQIYIRTKLRMIKFFSQDRNKHSKGIVHLLGEIT